MWPRIFRQAFVSYFRSNNGFIAGTLAFSALLAIFPFVIFLVSLTGLYSEALGVQQGIEYIISYLPVEVERIFTSVIVEITSTKSGGLMTFGFLGTLYVLVSAVDTLRIGLNQAYKVQETRPFIKRTLHNFGMVIFMSVALVLVSVLIILGPVILDYLYSTLPFTVEYSEQLNVLRYLSGFGVMVLLLTSAYFYLPNIHPLWRHCIPGAVFATFLWMLLASLFSLYLKYMDSYSITYGSLSGIIITMVFLKISAMIFLLGAEINHAYLQEAR